MSSRVYVRGPLRGLWNPTSGRDSDGRVVLVCKHAEAKSAKSFKLMMRNFEQRGGQVGKILCLKLLHEPTNDAAGDGPATTDVAPTADFARPRPDAMANAEIVFSLPPDFDRLAREKYEELFAIRAC